MNTLMTVAIVAICWTQAAAETKYAQTCKKHQLTILGKVEKSKHAKTENNWEMELRCAEILPSSTLLKSDTEIPGNHTIQATGKLVQFSRQHAIFRSYVSTEAPWPDLNPVAKQWVPQQINLAISYTNLQQTTLHKCLTWAVNPLLQ